MRVMIIKSILSILAFTFACAAGAFTFWIGGGQPFTHSAGTISALSISAGAFLSVLPWMYIDSDGKIR